MTLNSSLYLLPKFSRVPSTIALIRESLSTMVNGTLLNFGKRYEDDLTAFFFETGAMPTPTKLVGVGIAPVAKLALRFGCTRQSKNLEWYLIFRSLLLSLR